MENILIDAGPIIALFSSRDQHHSRAVEFLRGFKGVLLTTWPVITEASHLLSFSTQAQVNLLKWIQRGGLHLFDLQSNHLERLTQLCDRFKDVPMDLAYASLIIAAEESDIPKIVSIDADFYIYRDIRNRYLTNIF